MTQFIERKACSMAINKRKPSQGVGINDAWYSTTTEVNGKRVQCPYYQRWSDMLTRCYSEKYHDREPTYKGCYVCDEWLTFSNFKVWMEKQDWKGKQLDKDLLNQNNKEYSPDNCLFVSRHINSLLLTRVLHRGEFMLGVHLHKETGKFRSQCCDGKGKIIRLGLYSKELSAHNAYKKYKYALIAKIANEQSEPLKSALLNYEIPMY